MLKLRAGLLLGFVLAIISKAFGQAPDPRDSVILESKAVAPNLNGSPAFTIRVSITNKDTLANLTLPVEIKTVSGVAYVLLNSPRTFAGTINRLTSTLGNTTAFSPFLNDASPDSAIWAGFWNPSDTSTAEHPNFSRKAFLEIKFKHSSDSLGQVQIDSADIFDNRVGFVKVDGNSVRVNFVRSIVNVTDFAGCGLDCPRLLGVRFGRGFTRDFDCTFPGRWSLVSGPGRIDSLTGLYSFPGRCALGLMTVRIRYTTNAGPTSDCSFLINVYDGAPTASALESLVVVSHGQTANNQIHGSDSDPGDGVVFSRLSGPGTVNSNGRWSYPTTCADVGASPQTIRIKVSDAFDSCNPGPLADTATFQLVVTNAAPVITNCPADVVPADTGIAYSLQLSAIDADPADAGNLQFYLVLGPTGFTVSSSGLVHWTPAGSQQGLRSATVRVRDLCGAVANCQLNFAVSVRKGDLNADGQLTAADLVSQLNCIFQMIPPSVGSRGCDMNCNGENTGADAVLLLNAVFLGQGFPC